MRDQNYPGPFVKHTDRAADRAGDHVRYFFFCVSVGAGTGGGSGDIVMKHGQHFFKQIIPVRGAQKTGKEGIFHCIATDRQKIGLTDIAVIFRMKFFHYRKNIMDRLFLNSRYKRGDILIMIIKSTSRDTSCFGDIGYGDPVRSFLLYEFKKKLPGWLRLPQNIFHQELDFA